MSEKSKKKKVFGIPWLTAGTLVAVLSGTTQQLQAGVSEEKDSKKPTKGKVEAVEKGEIADKVKAGEKSKASKAKKLKKGGTRMGVRG